jgi:C1A family cysteine protease
MSNLPVGRLNRKYGYTGPQLTGISTTPFKRVRPKMTLAQAPRVKYNICPPVRDQGQIGDCVEFAWTYLKSANLIVAGKLPVQVFSPLELYYDYRDKVLHDVADDAGSGVMAVGTLLTRDGVCAEDLWPYNPAEFAVKPSPLAYADAPANKLASVHPLETLEDMILCLADGYGFVAGISVFQSFEDAWQKDGIIPMPGGASDKFLGGHGVFVGGGYDQDRRIFIVENSWGLSGGLANQKGFFSLPFDFLTDPDFVLEVGTGR